MIAWFFDLEHIPEKWKPVFRKRHAPALGHFEFMDASPQQERCLKDRETPDRQNLYLLARLKAGGQVKRI